MHIKVPDQIKDHMKNEIEKYTEVLKPLKKRELGEADTANLIFDMLSDIFDYDRVANVTAEYRIRGKFADFVIRLDGDLKMVIEAKEFNLKLNENHLAQAVGYAANEGIEWAVLTNAHMWQLYHITFARPITQELVFSVDLLDESIALGDKVKFLYLISKQSLTEDIVAKDPVKRDLLGASVSQGPGRIVPGCSARNEFDLHVVVEIPGELIDVGVDLMPAGEGGAIPYAADVDLEIGHPKGGL